MSQQTSTLPPSPQEKKPFGKSVIIGVLVVVIIALVVFAFVFLIPIINRPRPEITLVSGYGVFQGSINQYIINVTVKNNGADGWVRVYAEIYGAGMYEKQDQRIYLASGESKSLQLVFDIPGALPFLSTPPISYKACAVAD
jgi:uncharacterized protein (TIGR02588 family)